jgi:hypothetical protein
MRLKIKEGKEFRAMNLMERGRGKAGKRDEERNEPAISITGSLVKFT